jgi:hypothetical protein
MADHAHQSVTKRFFMLSGASQMLALDVPVRREISGVQVQQQGLHTLLVIYLRVNSTNSQVALAYQASLLAGPVAR